VPQAKVAWTDVWIGGGITGVLYMLGSALIVVKLGHSPLATFYGGAGSLVLVLLWAYYSSQNRSIARISGYTVSHQPSGRAVLTRIRDKAAAFDLVRRLLALGEIDWHADRPLENPAALDAMLAVS
jgi:hypothetical protein